jgi:hypothetical protein
MLSDACPSSFLYVDKEKSLLLTFFRGSDIHP